MTPPESLQDFFEDDTPPGRVVNARSQAGVRRGGVDREGVISIDHGALRIRPLVHPGWGRAGIAYGPFPRQNGLTVAVHILNGHNSSQTGSLNQSLARRVGRWFLGGAGESPVQRLIGWLRGGSKKNTWRQFQRWYWIDRRHKRNPLRLDESLAVGWFPDEVPEDPQQSGNAFIFHALGAENGELRVRGGGRQMPVVRGLQNVPLYLFVVLRERGAAYYAASLPNARGLRGYPALRPLGIDLQQRDESVYAAIYQGVLGQIGFRVDTRVYGVQVEHVPDWSAWYGTAHAADRLTGEGALHGSAAETGGEWRVLRGGFRRTPQGVQPTGADNLALLEPPAPAGLIHLRLDAPAREEAVPAVLWRVVDAENHWCLQLGKRGCRLQLKVGGREKTVADSITPGLHTAAPNDLQILDDGGAFALYLNGQLLFDRWFFDASLQEASGVGLHVSAAGPGGVFRSLEVHPRSVPAPAVFGFEPPRSWSGERTVVRDEFDGEQGDLDETVTTRGGRVWRKQIGRGVIERTGHGSARVRASLEHPNPGRTAYLIDWDTPGFAHLEVEITPPGTGRGQYHKGRGGLIFWQDADNYLIVSSWLDDFYDGASISSFFRLNGFEDLYEAVWTNVGKRIFWGLPFRLGVRFDGRGYTAMLNDEPVLYRALDDVRPEIERLVIRRVGIVANWEWGDDTGSVFRHFVAKTREGEVIV